MATISLRLKDSESKIIHEYVSINRLSMSELVRNAIFSYIDSQINSSEKLILEEIEKSKNEKTLTYDEVWK